MFDSSTALLVLILLGVIILIILVIAFMVSILGSGRDRSAALDRIDRTVSEISGRVDKTEPSQPAMIEVIAARIDTAEAQRAAGMLSEFDRLVDNAEGGTPPSQSVNSSSLSPTADHAGSGSVQVEVQQDNPNVAEIRIQSEPAAAPKAEPKGLPKAEPVVEPEAEPVVQNKPVVKPAVKSKPQPRGIPVEKPKAEPAVQSKPQPKAEPKQKPKMEPAVQRKPEVKPAVQSRKPEMQKKEPERKAMHAGGSSLIKQLQQALAEEEAAAAQAASVKPKPIKKEKTPAKAEPVKKTETPVEAEPVKKPEAPVKAEPVKKPEAPVKPKPVEKPEMPIKAETVKKPAAVKSEPKVVQEAKPEGKQPVRALYEGERRFTERNCGVDKRGRVYSAEELRKQIR